MRRAYKASPLVLGPDASMEDACAAVEEQAREQGQHHG